MPDRPIEPGCMYKVRFEGVEIKLEVIEPAPGIGRGWWHCRMVESGIEIPVHEGDFIDRD